MFKKIVSNITFSPALIDQLNIYIKKMRKDGLKRKITLFFVILIIIVQFFIIIQPSKTPDKIASVNDITPECNIYYANLNLWKSSLNCQNNLLKSQVALNISQGYIDASSTTAKHGDQISLTISIKNTSNSIITTEFKQNISDILEYSNLIDYGGWTLDEQNGDIYWPDVTLNPNELQIRKYVIKIMDPIPQNPINKTVLTSYDNIIDSNFGTTVRIKVERSFNKNIELILLQLPKVNILTNIVFTVILFIIILYFYTRNVELKKELYLIKKDTSSGVF